VYIRAFCDGNGDGKGDIEGLISKLDYLQELGVYCIWVLPLYPSPLKDDGYDVSDHCGVHPDYGSLSDVERLIKAAHERSMKIIFDFIPNHVSDQHRWFQEARKSKDSPYRDYFVWSQSPTRYQNARIIFLDLEPSNWVREVQSRNECSPAYLFLVDADI
jgi:maltose alpha-D-glucosyltransferase / alpha-amylase